MSVKKNVPKNEMTAVEPSPKPLPHTSRTLERAERSLMCSSSYPLFETMRLESVPLRDRV